VVVGAHCPAAQPQKTKCLNEIYSLFELVAYCKWGGFSAELLRRFTIRLQTIGEIRHRASRSYFFYERLPRVVYTVDDSADQTATAINPFMADTTSLREHVASIEERISFPQLA